MVWMVWMLVVRGEDGDGYGNGIVGRDGCTFSWFFLYL